MALIIFFVMNNGPDSQIGFKLLVWIGFTTNSFTEPHVVEFYFKWAKNRYCFVYFFLKHCYK